MDRRSIYRVSRRRRASVEQDTFRFVSRRRRVSVGPDGLTIRRAGRIFRLSMTRGPRRKPMRSGRRSNPRCSGPTCRWGRTSKASPELRAAFQHAEALRHAAKNPAYQQGSSCILPQHGAFHFGFHPIRLVLRSHRSTKARSPSPPATRIPGRSCLKLSDICCAPPSALRPVDEVRQEPVPLCAVFLV